MKQTTYNNRLYCTEFQCDNTKLKYMTKGQSHQTKNGFFVIKISGYYCPRCGAGYGGKK